MASEIQKVLAACLSTNQAELTQAMDFVNRAKNDPAQLGQFMAALSDEMANVANDQTMPGVRQQAGIQLKNCLVVSRNEAETEQRLAAWVTFPETVRAHIKQRCMASLGTETGASQAAGVIAAIARAEFPRGLWPDLMGVLVGGATSAAAPERAREAALKCIGYICENDDESLKPSANAILNAVTTCMRDEEPSNVVKLEAVSTLELSLPFCDAQFQNEPDRNHIMTVVCKMSQHADTEIQVKALQCLNKIMELQYGLMEQYMKPALFGISMQAMQHEDEDVALQGVEFWSAVCETEMDLEDELNQAQRQGKQPSQVGKQYTQGAQAHLIPALLALMEKQDEGDDPTDWDLSKAAHVCLKFVVETVRDSAVDLIVPYIMANLQNAAWQKRDTSVQAFGALLDGPDEQKLIVLVRQALPTLLGLMKDPTVVVRDSLAWVIGRLCDVLPEAIIAPGIIEPVAQALGMGLSMEPRVAANVCWAIGPLFEHAYEAAYNQSDSEPATFVLTQYTQQFVAGLLQTAARPDANQDNLLAAAYEALMTVVGNVPADCYPVVQQSGEQVLLRLRETVTEVSSGASFSKEQMNAIVAKQSVLCGMLTAVVQALKEEHVVPVGQQIMETIFGVFRAGTGASSAVQEDGLMVVGALANRLGVQFEPYLAAIKPFVAAGVQNVTAVDTCTVSVVLMGDIARNMGPRITPHCDEFMTALLTILKMPTLEPTIKPNVLSTCGDIATGIGGDAFGKYFQFVIAALQEASVSAAKDVSDEDYDTIDEQNALRHACLEAYTSIFMALKGDAAAPNPNVKHMMATVPHIIQFITLCLKDPELTEACIRDAAGIVGDFVECFGVEMKTILQPAFCAQLIQMAAQKDNNKMTRNNAKYLKQLLTNIGVPHGL